LVFEALHIFARLAVPTGTPVRLPDGPRGVYTAMRFPDDVRDVRIVHLDRYSGAVLADIRYGDYGIAGRAIEWGISIHTGRQFGWVNQLVMLAGCLAIVALAVSAAVMWWKRRPRGLLAAPPRRRAARATARRPGRSRSGRCWVCSIRCSEHPCSSRCGSMPSYPRACGSASACS
jgi:uncharacterized iron-regulated membrane protein